MTQELSIPFNDSELSALWSPAESASAVMILAHGSGAGKDHEFMTGYAQAVADLGISVLSFNFPYMDAGKKFPDKAPTAIAVWQQVRSWVQEHVAEGLPVVVAGKSFGGRMASLAVAEGMPANALIFLGYPLHAPKKEDKLRDEHLYPLTVPMLFLEGTKDPFANPEKMEAVAAKLNKSTELVWFEGGNHSFKVARSQRTVAQDGAWLAEATANFIWKHAS
ncbi:dienelactone hydrolase [Glutamicibacter halophytocola]|uniref:alpha/beta hydrolase family protein n=1 Tax=Glutamicibacter halophytocola TaxID=1933880 RepID=UPI0006D4A464|nr:alpha/beta family hydrolase [Glutamicibacter halophytocola]ALG27906.1 dienelactone hydrolase [Glutamicibacter halophytocola]